MRSVMFAVGALAFAVGCGDDDQAGGKGSLTLTLSGEEAAEVGYPVDEDLAFADGWTMKFDKYLVSLGNVRVAGADGKTAIADDRKVVADLTEGEADLFVIENLPARRWERFGYDILAPDANALRIGRVSETDVQRMIDENLNYLIVGTATKGDRVVHFDWGLSAPTRNDDCIDGSKPGVVIRNNAANPYQITLHLDHLFYDRLGDHEGEKMRFEPIAAMAVENGDRWEIPFERLAEQDWADPRDADGAPIVDGEGNRVEYWIPNGMALHGGEDNLKGYLLTASKSKGRFNGEGACTNTDWK